MIRAVLFDAAGTLIRVRGSVGEAYAAVAAAHGVSVADDEIEQRFGTAFRHMPPLCFPGRSLAEIPALERNWWKELVRRVFAGVAFPDFDAYFEELFEHFADPLSWELFPDVRPALDALADRAVRMAVVSNFDGRLTRICEGLGIEPFFETIVMSGRAGAAKPDAEIFRVALQAVGADAGEALHVGDSFEDDVRGAQSAGLRALRIARGEAGGGAQEIGDLRLVLDHLS